MSTSLYLDGSTAWEQIEAAADEAAFEVAVEDLEADFEAWLLQQKQAA